jgi:hypothetical protein
VEYYLTHVNAKLGVASRWQFGVAYARSLISVASPRIE